MVVIERAVKHLAVYEKGWLKIQMTKIVNTKRLPLIESYLDRAGVVCPIKYWDNLVEVFNLDPAMAYDSAFSLNTKKAVKFINKHGTKGSEDYLRYEKRFTIRQI